jgi:sialic acid synthase SpsE/quercetin dioxygenase-like cupin family protein
MALKDFLDAEKPLIVADLANNHSGDLKLAIDMLEELHEFQQKFKFRIAVKFQYRNLDTYIDNKFKGSKEYKFIDRFESTRLPWEDFFTLVATAKKLGLLTAATPFDEFSVEKVAEHKHDILKIASASANEWSLLEKSISKKIPMIVSVGGLNNYQIEKVVTFLKHREADFALMHCVALYPTPDSDLNLNRISIIKEHFKVVTGYSTHESPKNYLAGPLALASGAQILERHYAKSANGVSINGYSSQRHEFEVWLENLDSAIKQLFDKKYSENLIRQQSTLRQLQRGLFALRDIARGESVDLSNTYAAIPAQLDQLIVNDLSIHENFKSKKEISKGQPIKHEDIEKANRFRDIERILSETRTLVMKSGTTLSRDVDVEISHHFGLEKFNEFGAVLISIINREYGKKLVVMKKNQTHPEHFHKLKEETFVILIGQLEVTLNEVKHVLKPGEVLVIPRENKHSMLAVEDCVFEEISSTNFATDSFYTDAINLISKRKTVISLWF